MIQANWLVFIAALLIGIVVAYWLFARASKPAPRVHRPDVLDEGAAPAQRNQALIDEAPPAAQFAAPAPAAHVHIDPPAMAGTMAGIGELIAVAAQEEVDNVVPPQTIAAEPEPVAEPEPAPASTPVAPAATEAGDDLRKIKGLGPKMLTLLNSLGIARFEQIAAWTDADLDELDGKLGAFAGRPRRDNWVEQARLLASGDTGDYEAKFGKL
jgi:predicted flap endonuclease-1-like 5' DNA nuclease